MSVTADSSKRHEISARFSTIFILIMANRKSPPGDPMKTSFTSKFHRPYLMAVVLGTDLAASGNEASAEETSPKAISKISRYCTTCWRNARLPEDQWSDCTQEVLCRLLKNLSSNAWDNVLSLETEER